MPNENPLRIVVVGGAAAGMAAAVRCRRLDERAMITVIEKGPYASHANSGVPNVLDSVIEGDTALIPQTPAGLKARFNLELRINTELISISKKERTILLKSVDSEENVYHLSYDKLVLAIGADPALPEIEGIKGTRNFFTLRKQKDLQAIKAYISKHESRRATVIGAGFIGLRAAESLLRLGLQVTLIEASDQIHPAFDKDIAHYLQTELSSNKVQLYLGTTVQKLVMIDADDDCSHLQLDDGSVVATDLVVAAIGLNPRVSIARAAGLAAKRGVTVNTFMQTSDPDIYAIGDMVETENRLAHSPGILALGGPGSRQGRLAANHIYGQASAYAGNVGTFISKVFNLTVAMTGMSVKALRHIGYNPQWVTVHTPDHEGYYPASSLLTLRIIFEPYTGRLLGAQAVGKYGVDKRIDVLSTALQAGMSVFDLEQLELSYAPQYGTARDPVNVAGCAAGNILRQEVRTLHPNELVGHTSEWQIIDVRTAENYTQSNIPSSRNIPLDTLRENLDNIDKEHPVLVYSRVGYHGYIAHRILKQLGYEVANLDGGWKLWVPKFVACKATLCQNP
ncbi:pyridine nucleotide-disulfide oxidoreductase, putative [Talaromyces stipitatus ATCC 10500]|uniref:Pyridine nucleotide-disulfide oxidoreductase, putative n=1 Tax=Talaromyces stipitatus (strain ATCC 10500 / CBS 375.48 / QM 6759 / NRRL 1006) TaxID=441959 RepID=B8M1G8_TALSN|nr:pyridine nucleotide-disulfide oxidoreductase, putative [Talaromyces stipitatus ATCC 10500]EED21864.1 pyridine nucleotide-disulfide oxidoreductase, putative [Talaromyces stipitatus ATCC 10500]